MTRFWIVTLSVTILALKVRAENCFDYDKDLEEAINVCNECSKNVTDKGVIGLCILQKEGLIDKDGMIKEDKLTEYFLEGFKGDGTKKEELKKDLDECVKNSFKSGESGEFAELDKCMDTALIKQCPEAEEKIKEAKTNESLKKCW